MEFQVFESKISKSDIIFGYLRLQLARASGPGRLQVDDDPLISSLQVTLLKPLQAEPNKNICFGSVLLWAIRY